jgi:hypothetical protein
MRNVTYSPGVYDNRSWVNLNDKYVSIRDMYIELHNICPQLALESHIRLFPVTVIYHKRYITAIILTSPGIVHSFTTVIQGNVLPQIGEY